MPRRGRIGHTRSLPPLAMAAVIGLAFTVPSPFRSLISQLEWTSYDALVTWLPTATPSGRVVPVLITQEGVNLFGRWPWSREVFALFLKTCHDHGVAAVVFDVLFSERADAAADGNTLLTLPWDRDADRTPDTELAAATYDDLFAAATGAMGNVFLAAVLNVEARGTALLLADELAAQRAAQARHRERFALSEVPPGSARLVTGHDWLLPYPELAAAAAGVGAINVPRDNVIRRTYLLTRHSDAVFASLDVQAAAAVLGAASIVWGDGLELRDARGGAIRRLPMAADGTMYVNFAPTSRYLHPDLALDFADVLIAAGQLEDGLPPVVDLDQRLRDKIVLVGMGLDGATDIAPVPNDDQVPLMLVHANVLDNILQRSFRYPVAYPDTAAGQALVLSLSLLLGLALPRLSYWMGGVLVLGMGAAALGTVAAVAWLTPAVGPLLAPGQACLLTFTAITSHSLLNEYKERRRTREMWARYTSPEVVDEVLSDPNKAGLFGERRKVTVISVDVRGFTSHSEAHQPEEVVALLNRYFAVMAEVVFRHRGTINNYIGDCMMVLFGAPLQAEDDTARAVRTAWEIREAVRRLREESGGALTLGVGIGINTGEAVVGNIGAEQFMSYTVIGDAVNTAFRLENLAQRDQIILSEATYREVESLVCVRGLAPATLKGKRAPVVIFELEGLRERAGNHAARSDPAPTA